MIAIRDARQEEFAAIGELMVRVYAGLPGFPGPDEQPAYYSMLANVGALTERPGVDLVVAEHEVFGLVGAVVFIADMKHYGSGGTATQERDACGFRLLAVDPGARGLGIGRRLTQACIDRVQQLCRSKLVIHTTDSMRVAWGMYERMGFKRTEDLDFLQGELPVFGFRLRTDTAGGKRDE
ncbi:MAG: GNAT family N-acetyltransferase [Rhodothermales bacterium]|nr:GNAT family N-acetyltransferase [Rhodothermales bacterium]